MGERYRRVLFRRMIDLLVRNRRPTHLGDLSMEVKLSFSQTEKLVEELILLGAVKYLTVGEKRSAGLPVDNYIVMLLDESLVPHADC